MSMYLPKRLELSLRNVLALPKAWSERQSGRKRERRRGGMMGVKEEERENTRGKCEKDTMADEEREAK